MSEIRYTFGGERMYPESEVAALRAENARLRAALEPFAEYWRIKTNIRQTPKAGAWHAVASRDGEAELTAEHFAEARAALAPQEDRT